MKLSVIVPVYNAKIYLEQMLGSLFDNTESEFELIIIDDFSDEPTRKAVQSIESPTVPIQIILNDQHRWTNYNWNLGTMVATGDYIAILNSDILLSKGWDTKLIEALQGKPETKEEPAIPPCTIACPYEQKNGELITLDPLIAEIDLYMIKGACFMFKASDKKRLFPIPQRLKHWCGDNWLADIANQLGGVKFVKDAMITHYTSASAKTLDPEVYYQTVYRDLDEYERISGRSMKKVKDKLR